MSRSTLQGMTKSPRVCRRWGLLGAATAAIVSLAMAWGVSPGHAEGPLYVLPPSNLSPGQESVEFTNHLNSRLPHVPAELNPPEAATPEQVEARIGALERGVELEGGAKTLGGAGSSEADPRAPSVAGADEAEGQESAAAADEPAPLDGAFIGAGVLALLGLILGVFRGWHPGSTQQARP